MSKYDGGPAFPCEWDYISSNREEANGMTLRDYFAAKAMLGLIAEPQWGSSIAMAYSLSEKSDSQEKNIAFSAYKIADAMLEARNV